MVIFLTIVLTIGILIGVYFLGQLIFGNSDRSLGAIILETFLTLLFTACISGVIFGLAFGIYALLNASF